MERSREWLPPLTGVGAVVLIVVGALVLGETPDATEASAQEVVEFYAENEDAGFVATTLLSLGAILFVFFGGWLRSLLRDAEGEGGMLSVVALAGAIVFAAALAIGSMLVVALVDSVEEIEPVAMQALNALSWNFFLSLAVGLATLFAAAGISIVRHGAMPGWLGWAAIVIALGGVTPAAFFAYVVGGAWIVLVAILGARGAAAAHSA